MIIPSAFQTPNSHVDIAMHYLSGDEYKVLNFAIRHIFGWQDKLHQRCGDISLTMFADGFTTADGTRYHGTGLNRQAVIRVLEALVKYRLLIKVGAPTTKGQRWQIGDNPDWEGLKTREDGTRQQNQKRTKVARQKAAQKRQKDAQEDADSAVSTAGMSDNTSTVGHTSAGMSDNTSAGMSDNTESKPLQNQVKDNIAASDDAQRNPLSDRPESDRPDGVPDSTSEDPPADPSGQVAAPSAGQSRNAARHALYIALLQQWGLTEEIMTKTASGPYWKCARELLTINFPAGQVAALYRFVEAKAEKWDGVSFTVSALAKYVPEFLAQNQQQAGSPTAPANGGQPDPLRDADGMPTDPFWRGVRDRMWGEDGDEGGELSTEEALAQMNAAQEKLLAKWQQGGFGDD